MSIDIERTVIYRRTTDFMNDTRMLPEERAMVNELMPRETTTIIAGDDGYLQITRECGHVVVMSLTPDHIAAIAEWHNKRIDRRIGPCEAEPRTTVVNISRSEHCDLVIDRRTEWGNEFRVGTHGWTREEVVGLHLLKLFNDSGFVRKAREFMTGKRLGCHCAPKLCHGENYVAICHPAFLTDHVAKVTAQLILTDKGQLAEHLWLAMPGIEGDKLNFAGKLV